MLNGKSIECDKILEYTAEKNSVTRHDVNVEAGERSCFKIRKGTCKLGFVINSENEVSYIVYESHDSDIANIDEKHEYLTIKTTPGYYLNNDQDNKNSYATIVLESNDDETVHISIISSNKNKQLFETFDLNTTFELNSENESSEPKKRSYNMEQFLFYLTLFLYCDAGVHVVLLVALIVLGIIHPNRLYKVGCESYAFFCCCPGYLRQFQIFYSHHQRVFTCDKNLWCSCCCCAKPIPGIHRQWYVDNVKEEERINHEKGIEMETHKLEKQSYRYESAPEEYARVSTTYTGENFSLCSGCDDYCDNCCDCWCNAKDCCCEILDYSGKTFCCCLHCKCCSSCSDFYQCEKLPECGRLKDCGNCSNVYGIECSDGNRLCYFFIYICSRIFVCLWMVARHTCISYD